VGSGGTACGVRLRDQQEPSAGQVLHLDFGDSVAGSAGQAEERKEQIPDMIKNSLMEDP
jgi:hypothetical protein